MTRTRETIINDIINYFEENEALFDSCIEELDGYNGYLGDDRYYEMEMLGELFDGVDPVDLLNRAFFGYDLDTWHTDGLGQKEYGAFNPNRNYFSFNGYGNLVSSNYKDYSAQLDHWAIESMLENRAFISEIEANEELDKLFNMLAANEEK